MVKTNNNSYVCMDIYEAPNIKGKNPLVMYHLNEAEDWCNYRNKRLCYEHEWQAACSSNNQYNYPYGSTFIPGYCNDKRTWKLYNQTILNLWLNGYSTPDIDSFDSLMEKVSRSNHPRSIELVNHLKWLYQAWKIGDGDSHCTSSYGIVDTCGNVEEWTRRLNGVNLFHGNLKGRYWSESRTCMSNITTHGDLFRFYEIGFRCCKQCK